MSSPFGEDLLLGCILEKNGVRTAFIGYSGAWIDGYGKYATYKEALEIDWEDFYQSQAVIDAIIRALEADVRCIFAIDTVYDAHGESKLEANKEIQRLTLELEKICQDRKCGVLVFSDHGDHDKTWQHYEKTKEIKIFDPRVLDALIAARGIRETFNKQC